MNRQGAKTCFLAVIFIAFITGCYGGSSGTSDSSTTLEISSTYPANNATDVAINTTITATFSDAIDPSSINTSTFAITSNRGNVAGDVTYDSSTNTATFMPSAPLVYNTIYTATLTTGIRDSSGNVMPNPYTWQFTTHAQVWGTAELINSGAGAVGAYSPQIAVDRNGNAIAVWYQWDWDSDGTGNIYANTYTAGIGWGTPTLIENDTGDAYFPQIAFDANGNAIAIWHQYDVNDLYASIYANRYTVGSGWGTPEIIENNTESATSPQLAIDPSGNAIAVWQQYDGTNYKVYSNTYTAGIGWGIEQMIADDTGDDPKPNIAIDANGNAIVVWKQSGSNYNDNSIYANAYTAGIGWGTMQLIGKGYSTSDPQIAIDSSGNAIAIWDQWDNYQWDNYYRNIYANTYTAGIGWGTASLIENNTGDSQSAHLVFDASGNAIAVWEQNYNIYSNTYTAGIGWGTPTLIENDTGDAFAPRIAIDTSGNAIAVWSQKWSDGTNYDEYIYFNTYTAGIGWGTSMSIENNNKRYSYSPQIATDASGNAIVVWENCDNTYIYCDIYANSLR